MCSNSKWVIKPSELYANALFRRTINGTICCKSEIMANTRLVNVRRSRPGTTMWPDPGGGAGALNSRLYLCPFKIA